MTTWTPIALALLVVCVGTAAQDVCAKHKARFAKMGCEQQEPADLKCKQLLFIHCKKGCIEGQQDTSLSACNDVAGNPVCDLLQVRFDRNGCADPEKKDSKKCKRIARKLAKKNCVDSGGDADHVASCPEGFTEVVEGKCYAAVKERKSFEDAKETCKNLGGDIANFKQDIKVLDKNVLTAKLSDESLFDNEAYYWAEKDDGTCRDFYWQQDALWTYLDNFCSAKFPFVCMAALQ